MKYIYVNCCDNCKELQGRWFEEGSKCWKCDQPYAPNQSFSFELAMLTQLQDIESLMRIIWDDL
jgi:hypothetical protein